MKARAARLLAWMLLALVPALSFFGVFEKPSGPAGRLFFIYALLAYGPLLAFGLILARGKPAPALRTRSAALALAVAAQAGVLLSGGLASPLLPALALLGLLVRAFAGWRTALLASAWACLGLIPLAWRAEAGWPAALAALAAPWLGAWAGSLARPGLPQAEARPPLAAPQEPLAASLAPLPAFDAQAFIEQSCGQLLDLAFNAQPAWQSLLLLWAEEGPGGGMALRCRALRSRAAATRMDWQLAEGEGLFGWVLKERKSLVVADLPASSASALPHYPGPAAARAAACVPFFSEGELMGALAMDKLEPGVAPSEAALLEALGMQLVQAVHLARHAEQARAQSGQYSRLHEASRQLGQDLDREALLASLPGLLASLVPHDSLYLALRDGEGSFSLALSQGYAPGFEQRFSQLDLGEGLSGWVLCQAESVAFSAQGSEGQVPAFLGEGLAMPPYSSLLVPLQISQRVTGLLKLDRRRGPAFAERDREVAGIFASQVAITLENARLYTLHKQLATTDGLTGLYNHRYFQERLALELEKSGRSGAPLCMALLDIDLFKKFNDTFGHQEGDAVLRRVAGLMRQQARPGCDIPCRYGGEEFVMVYPGTSLPEAIQLADALRAESAMSLKGGNAEEQRPITFSIGVAAFPMTARDQRQLIHQADEALYLAKKNGRNRVCSAKDLA
jgi:diguanylate cyclase (GGDEF)-like protein